MISIILLSIFIPLITITILFIFVYRWFISYDVKAFIPKRGTSLYKFDLLHRKYAPYAFDEQKPFARNISKVIGEWSPFSDIQMHFKSEKAKKMFSNAFHALENKAEFYEFEVNEILPGKRSSEAKFYFKFSEIEGDSDYILRIKWASLNFKDRKSINPNLLSKEDVISIPFLYKSFVAFNISTETENADARIAKMASEIFGVSLNYFVSAGFIVFVFGGKSADDTWKKTERFISRFKSRGFIKGANHLFDGSAVAMSKSISDFKNLNGLIQTLDFLINISINNRENFISYKKYLDRDEFNKFKDASQSFRTALKTENIIYQELDVRDWKTRRKRIKYIYPTISGINNRLISVILRNKNNKDALIDAQASMIAIKNKIDDPVLVDINATWLAENYKNMKFKKAIYIINLNQSRETEELRTIIKELDSKGFTFALRVSKYTEEISTFIHKINIKFLIIDSIFWGKELIDSNELISLMTLKKVADEKKVYMIYEQPSTLVDKVTAEKIGLKFFYNFK